MENLTIKLLSDNALEELKEMERNNKIKILNVEEIEKEKVEKEKMLSEVENYTYETILKRLKNLDS